MKKLLAALGLLFSYSQGNHVSDKQFVIIGGEVFAVAHSQKEMAELMRRKRADVTGYLFSHDNRNAA